MILRDTITDLFLDGGIFKALQPKANMEWLTASNSLTYDLDYYSRSGEKLISPTYKMLLAFEEEGKIEDTLSRLADIILARYTDKWNKVYNSYVKSDYDPLTNTKTTRNRTQKDDFNETKTEDTTRDDTSTSNTSTTNTEDTSINNEGSQDNSVFGFNSSTAVDSDKVINENNQSVDSSVTGSSENTSTLKRTDALEGSRDYNKDTKEDIIVEGLTDESSYQKLLADELELRKYIFIKQVYQDIDEVLVLGIYD